MRAPVTPSMMTGMRPGRSSQMPGASINAFPGGYFAANRGVTRTCGCSKNSGIGAESAHFPVANSLAWRMYAASS